MEISLNKIYLYDYVHRLLLNDGRLGCIDKDNAPMNKKTIKLHKGVDNSIKFRVFGPDRNPLQICGFPDIYARLISYDNRTIAIEKLCSKGSALGMLSVEFNEGDITNLPPGLYDMAIIGVNDFVSGQRLSEVSLTPFYTDFDNNVVMTIRITEQAQRAPIPSKVIGVDDWTTLVEVANGTGPYISAFYSSSIPGARVRNHTNSVHTYSVYATNFTGKLEVFGTLEETPNPGLERGWFKIFPDTGVDKIEFFDFSGTEAFSFQANFMWMKFKLTPDSTVMDNGELKKIIVRT